MGPVGDFLDKNSSIYIYIYNVEFWVDDEFINL